MRVATREEALEVLMALDIECPYCSGEKEYAWEALDDLPVKRKYKYQCLLRWCSRGHILAEVRIG